MGRSLLDGSDGEKARDLDALRLLGCGRRGKSPRSTALLRRSDVADENAFASDLGCETGIAEQACDLVGVCVEPAPPQLRWSVPFRHQSGEGRLDLLKRELRRELAFQTPEMLA